MISLDKINEFRDEVNSDKFVLSKYKMVNGKNQWGCICSAMDWITVAIEYIMHFHVDKGYIQSMEMYAYISSIDVVWEGIQQLHRVLFHDKKYLPFAGKYECFSNRIYEEKADNEIIKVQYKKEEKKSFLEIICGLIDTLNNIFFKIVRNDQVLIKLPLTVVILLLFFTFWISVPLFIIGFFYDVEYSFVGRGAENKKINNFLRNVSREIHYRKNNRKERRG